MDHALLEGSFFERRGTTTLPTSDEALTAEEIGVLWFMQISNPIAWTKYLVDDHAVYAVLKIREFELTRVPCSLGDWDRMGKYLPVYLTHTTTTHISLHKHWEVVQPYVTTLAHNVFRNRQTALMFAARYHPEAVPSILAAGPNVDLQSAEGWTALMFATCHHPEVVPAILAAGPDVDLQTTYTGHSAIMFAARYQPEAVSVILTAKPNVDLQNAEGWTALMFAARYHPGVVPAILAAGPDIDLQNAGGWTALMIAARYHPDIVPVINTQAPDNDES